MAENRPTPTWRHRYAVLACGCQVVPQERARVYDERPCELHGGTWYVKITEVSER